MQNAHSPDLPVDPSGSRTARTIALILASVRKHLGMDLAFVARFREQDRVVEYVDADAAMARLTAGRLLPLSEGYCQRIVSGELPEVIADTSQLAASEALTPRGATPIGAHIGIPIRFADGDLYGTFCCASYTIKPDLGDRDLRMMRAFGDLIADELSAQSRSAKHLQAQFDRISAAIDTGDFDIVFQPILNLRRSTIEGFECLSRFVTRADRSGDVAHSWTTADWFSRAHDVGLGIDLELAAIRCSLRHLDAFSPSTYLALNASVATVLSGLLPGAFEAYPGSRIVLELTEHEYVDDYPALIEALAPLRAAGIRIAIDDSGAGHSSMRHVLQLEPDKIKLDISLTRDIDSDPRKRALVAALCAFGRESGAAIVAEGVEHSPERSTLASLGVECLQGYLVAQPLRLPDAVKLDGNGLRRAASPD